MSVSAVIVSKNSQLRKSISQKAQLFADNFPALSHNNL
jgi:hypothetical protein